MQALNGPLIAAQDELAATVDALGSSSTIGIDTEFVRERTYFPRLCLLQVATASSAACIDCLAEIDLDSLFEIMLTRRVVLHSARQDFEVIFNRVARLPAVLFDTQIAAGLLGFAPQVGLQELLREVLAVELDKSQTRTDWARRPLPAAALEYALDDVRYLLPLATELSERLHALERYAWFEEDCRRALATPPVADDVAIWQRTKGIGRLDSRAQVAALALVGWREQRARAADRPRRWILSDELLVRIAAEHPANAAELAAIEGLPRRLAERSGREMLAALAEADSADLREQVAGTLRDRAPDKKALKVLQARTRDAADALGINAEILATKRDLTATVLGHPRAALATGWRAEVLDLAARG